MEKQPQVSFHGLDSDAEIQAMCFAEIDKLERFFNRITSCHVVITTANKRHQNGNLFDVRIDLSVPGTELVVNRTPAEHHRDEDLKVAVHDAFKRSRRQLEDYVSKSLRRDVKHHQS